MADSSSIPPLDNPQSNLFDAVFNLGFSPNNVSSKLTAALGINRDPSLATTYLSKIDKYGLAPRISRMQSYTGLSSTKTLIQSLKSSNMLSEGMESALIGLSRLGGSFYHSGKSLFYGDRATGTFAALPIQAGRNDIVSIGFKTRASTLITQINNLAIRTFSFADAYYTTVTSKLARNELNISNFDKFLGGGIFKTKLSSIGATVAHPLDTFYNTPQAIANLLASNPDDPYALYLRNRLQGTNIGGYTTPEKVDLDTTLGRVLQNGEYTRGIRGAFGPRSVSLKQTIVGSSPIIDLRNRFREAKRALSQIVKSSGYIAKSTRSLSIFAGLEEGFTTDQAFARIHETMNAFSEGMPEMFSKLGVKGLWPLIKAEYLFDKSNLTLPTSQAGDIFGSSFNAQFYSKGLHQLYRKLGTTGRQAVRSLRLRDNPISSFITKGAYEAGEVFQNMNMPLRVGVLDFKTDMHSRLLLQEGGAILTTRGSYKLATPLNIGSISINNPNEATLSAIEGLFDVNLGSGQSLNDLKRKIKFRAKDVERVMRAKNLSELSDKDRMLREIISKSKQYRNVWKGISKHGGILSSIESREGSLLLNFSSNGIDTPASLEMEIGARRFTTIKTLKNHKLAGILKQLGMSGVDLLISRDEFAKMLGPQVFLENFFNTLQRNDMLHEAASIVIDNPHIKIAGGKIRKAIPMISDHESAYDAAQKIVAGLLSSGDEKKIKVAREIQEGQDVLFNTHGLDRLGITGLKVFNIGGSVRSDFMMDINLMKSTRMTPSKMRSIALGSKLLGYDSPYSDPLFYAFAKAWHGRGIGINPKSLDLFLEDHHLARQFAKSVTGTINPQADRVIRLTENGLFLGERKLKSLPELAEFGFRNKGLNPPGVSFDDLEGTILDRRLGKQAGILYLDLGKEFNMPEIAGGAGAARSKYIPIPVKYLRTERGVAGRLALTKDHPAYNMVKALSILQNNPDIILRDASHLTSKSKELQNEFFKLVQASTTTTLIKLAGKKRTGGGLFEDQNSILVPGSTRARLIPDRSGLSSIKDMGDLDKVFTVDIGRSELEEVLYRRYYKDARLAKVGGYDLQGLKKVTKTINERGFTYAMIGADPVQRPEHQMLVKLRVVDTLKRDRKFAQLNLSMHPLLMRMLERDTDRDAATVHFIEALLHKDSKFSITDLEERLSRQKNNLGLFRAYNVYDLLNTPEGSPFGKIGEFTSRLFSGFTGQKATASLGYSFSRPIDAFMHAVTTSGIEGAAELGMRVEDNIVSALVKPFAGDAQRAAVAETLAQNLFQGGVTKGSAKSALIGVTQKIALIAREASSKYNTYGVFDYEDIVARSEKAFYDFLSSPGTKNREFLTTKYLLRHESQEAIQKVEEDLMRGNFETLELFRDKSKRAAARILAEWYGAGHAVNAINKTPVPSIMGVIYANKGSLQASPEMLATRVLGPLAGESVTLNANRLNIPLLDKIEEEASAAARTISLDDIYKSAASFFKHPSFVKGLGIGAIAGAIGVSAITSPDVSQPSDIGPSLAFNQSNIPRVYGPGFTMSTKRGDPAVLNSIQKYDYSSQNFNVSIMDNTSPFDPKLAKAHMDRIANSDFVY